MGKEGWPGTRQHVSVETHQPSFITSPTVRLQFSSEARLCSCQQAPSGSRKTYREKHYCNLCHIFLSPPFTTRMQISHSFSKRLHKHHINFVHISPKKSANCYNNLDSQIYFPGIVDYWQLRCSHLSFHNEDNLVNKPNFFQKKKETASKYAVTIKSHERVWRRKQFWLNSASTHCFLHCIL